MPKEVVINERCTMLLPITFLDEDGVERDPDSAAYRIDDPASFTEIQPFSDLPLESSQRVEITPVQNRIIDDSNATEERIITFDWTYHNSDRRGTDEYRYKVRNMYGIRTASASMSPSSSPSASLSPSSSPSSSTSPSSSLSPSASASPST